MKYIQLYYDTVDACVALSDQQFGRLIRGILHYAASGEIPSLKGAERHYLARYMQDIDRDKKAYADKCRKMKENIEKRWHTNEYNCNQDKDKDEDKDKDKDKDEHSPHKRYGARGKRKLKNNSQTTIRKEDLFIPFWELEGLDDEDDRPDANEDVLSGETGENDDIM